MNTTYLGVFILGAFFYYLIKWSIAFMEQGGCQHDFQCVWEEKCRDMNGVRLSTTGISAKEYRELLYRKVYLNHICVKCGKTVQRRRWFNA